MNFFFPMDLFGIMFSVVFLMGITVFIIILVKRIGTWNKNNHSPVLTVPAVIVTKRAHVSHHRHSGASGHHHHHTSTSYYVTFQVESGDRMELHVPAQEYGLLVEGDFGNLTFQGTRYLEFERQ